MGGIVAAVAVAAVAAVARGHDDFASPRGHDFAVFKNYTLSSWLLSFPPERGAGSALRLYGHTLPKRTAVCVPPKCGSMAAQRVWRGGRVEWLGEDGHVRWPEHSRDPLSRPEATHAAVTAVLTDPAFLRVAIVRHPVERVLSSLRAFGVDQLGCESCRGDAFKGELAKIADPFAQKQRKYLQYATHELVRQLRLPCDDQRLRVNQHVRSLRCFCGFQVPGVLAATRVFRQGHGEDMARLPGLIPDADKWNERMYGRFKNLTAVEFLTPRNLDLTSVHASHTADHTAEYDAALIDAIYDAVADDLALFAPLGYFTDRGPPFH